MYSNYDLTSVKTPVRADVLNQLLFETNFDPEKRRFLVDGFRYGFDLKYEGTRDFSRTSPNLKFTIGDKLELWNKVMKEVQLGRYAGPYLEPPFEHFIQSPIGLVPKDGGKKTRLIFHLSYPRETGNSVNACTPKEVCTVKYKDFDDAVRLCMNEGKHCKAGKTDLTSAFRILGVRPQDWPLLVMKAECPLDHKTYYFVDKCLPFGHAISCALFQKVSDALSHIARIKTGKENVNYLDDFFFVALYKAWCDNQIQMFVSICQAIDFPVSAEKTVWGSSRLTFLGLLIDTILQLICVPEEKIIKLIRLLEETLKKCSIKLRDLQSLCGHLNFVCKAVVPGRPFTRRLYYATATKEQNKQLKPHHHVNVNRELKLDIKMWLEFLRSPSAYCRPFLDLKTGITAEEVFWFTDTAKGAARGCGGVCLDNWFALKWPKGFIQTYDPSIAFLELYAVAVSVMHWIHLFKNKRIILFCDNISVVYMLNRNTSSCKYCLTLIRVIVLECMKQNVRLFGNYINTKANILADLLSRGSFQNSSD